MDSVLHQVQQQQLKLMELFIETLSPLQQTLQETKSYTPGDVKSVGHSITEFHYDTEMIWIISMWLLRYEDLVTVESKKWWKIGKLGFYLKKLGSAEDDLYSKYILPKQHRDYNLTESAEILKQIFGEYASILNIRFNCLNITKFDRADLMT